MCFSSCVFVLMAYAFPASEALHNLRRNRVFACRKIQGTYFEICALYFKISQTFF